MDLTPKQQASEAVRQAEAILIVTAARPNIDQVSSVIALAQILRKLGKKVTALVSEQTPTSIQFLTTGQIDKNLSGLRDFIIKVDLSKAEVDKIKYTIENGKLNVHVTPFKGGFSGSDVSYAHGDYHYDLVIALGVPSRDKLDRVFESAPQLSNIPMLNIDYHRINTSYAAVNLVDTYAATLAEMLISLSESLQNGLIDEPVATAMLTGIIASTDRFSAPHTTAKSMTVAAQLMAAGAKQQQIIKALYLGQESRNKSHESRGQESRGGQRMDSRHESKPQPQQSTSRPTQQGEESSVALKATQQPSALEPAVPLETQQPLVSEPAQTSPPTQSEPTPPSEPPQPSAPLSQPVVDIPDVPTAPVSPAVPEPAPQPEVPTAPAHNPLETPLPPEAQADTGPLNWDDRAVANAEEAHFESQPQPSRAM